MRPLSTHKHPLLFGGESWIRPTRSPLVFSLGLLAACAIANEPAADDLSSSVAASPSAPPSDGVAMPMPSDPCLAPWELSAQGIVVSVPAECAPYDLDHGDPAPEEHGLEQAQRLRGARAHR
jgi:hypothetical protein